MKAEGQARAKECRRLVGGEENKVPTDLEMGGQATGLSSSAWMLAKDRAGDYSWTMPSQFHNAAAM